VKSMAGAARCVKSPSIRARSGARVSPRQASALTALRSGGSGPHFPPGDARKGPAEAEGILHWQPLADRLAERFPERWEDTSGDAVSAECRARGVPSVVVKVDGQAARGCRRSDIETAAATS
jgi:hypothetical protein